MACSAAAANVVSLQQAHSAALLDALPERSPPGSSQQGAQTQLPPSQLDPVGGAQKEDVNWLLDDRLIDARVAWQKALQNIAGISEHISELEVMWKQLALLSPEKTVMARRTGLIQARRDFADASDDLRGMPTFAETELVIRWRGLMKTAIAVVNEQ